MNIAYIVIAHCDPEQLCKEVKALLQTGDVYIHINKNNDISPFKRTLNKIVYTNNNVYYLVEKRHHVNWGGFSILKATFSTLEYCLENKSYDRIILLTGLDYPIKSPSFIINFFENNKNIEFIRSSICLGVKYPNSLKIIIRDCKWYMKIYTFLSKIIPEKFLHWKKDFIMYKKRKYYLYGPCPKWAITDKSARLLLSFYKRNKRINFYFKTKHAPDDTYVATILRILGIKEENISNKKLFYEKETFNNISCQTLTEEDYEELVNVDALFARKFQSNLSNNLISLLDSTNNTYL